MAGKGITYAGSLVADTSFKIDAYPREGMQCHITEVKYFAGGIGNNICQMASIDPTIPVHVCGIAGEDDGGENFIRIVSAYPNVDLGPLVREGATSNTLVMNSLESKQRTFFSRPGGSRIFCEDHIDWDKVDCDIFHLEYLLALAKCDEDDPEYGTHGARILHDARERGFRTSIDIVSKDHPKAHHILKSALAYTDYCIINEIETKIVTGIDVMNEDGTINEELALEALQMMRELGATTWAAIHTTRMACGLDCKTGEFVSVRSLKIEKDEILGSTGAGDAFNSGMLYQAYKGSDLRTAMRFAAATAAMSLLGESGYASVGTEEEIWAFEAERRVD